MITCLSCGRQRPLCGRGLCGACWRYAQRHGTLERYPCYQPRGRRAYDHERYLRRKALALIAEAARG